ncbi:exonuclease domain-containing protein [Gordonia sp. VNK21]|uniref:exonuclease domain-containing protein n=1 Tax=Gordonia sp. VNK21 TaxID=3382483 RepID=UPI0038D3EDDC
MSRGFAVLDFETTGLNAARSDRIVEVGVVHLDDDLAISKALETLVNPRRDVGPTRLHGVTARDVFDAPTFDQVAPALLDALDGRVLVGHNIAFDLRFLAAELQRHGHACPEVIALDTMALARRLLHADPPPCYKLRDVAAHLGFTVDDVFAHATDDARTEHSAYGDALVTAHVLAQFIVGSSGSDFWAQHLDLAEQVRWPSRPSGGFTPVKLRGQSASQQPQAPTIHAVLRAVSSAAQTPVSTARYTALLRDALADRILDVDEVDALIETAHVLGLDHATLGSLHRGHFDAVVTQAWADGILTPDEAADIIRVAELLGIDGDSVRTALRGQYDHAPAQCQPEPAPQIVLSPGSIIVLTGDMTVARSEVEAEITARGYVVGKSLTKKTALLIAADTYTRSTKAKKARQYGITVLGEADGLALIRR